MTWGVRFFGLAAWVLVVAYRSVAGPPESPALVERTIGEIDKLFAADWAAKRITPADPADDAEFARRVYLDLLGRIPKVGELTAFVADGEPNKRKKLIDSLMTMPAFARHWASSTRDEWLPQTNNDIRFASSGTVFKEWLTDQFAINRPMNELVRELLTVEGVGRFNALDRGRQQDPKFRGAVAFYDANESRPENVAAAATRIFMGVKVECAQCHDHPFAPYTKELFWQTAAFFGEFAALPPVPPSFVGPLPPQADKNQITIPNTTTTVSAQFFDGTTPTWRPDRGPRQEFADWLLAKNNRFFPRNVANRTWARFLGVGLVDPIDDHGEANPPSHPAVLERLADAFVESGYDLRTLVHIVVGSRAYQLSSKSTHPSQNDLRSFARMTVKGLTGDQIFDSFRTATGLRGELPNAAMTAGEDSQRLPLRTRFRQKFGVPNKPTDSPTSILQALLLMNSPAMAQQTDIRTGETLAAIDATPFFSTDEKIETLFLAAFARRPTAAEKEKYGSFVARGGTPADRSAALADVFWVLLNSTEFMFNH